MCIINNSYQFIFVHVPKAAGTSVTNALQQYTNYCDIELGGSVYGEAIQAAYARRFGLSKHSPASDIRATIGSVQWSKYFSFSIVRNPFARCLSTFHFLRKWEGSSPEFVKMMREFRSFDEYVLSDVWDKTNGPDNIFRQQIYWLRGGGQHNTNLLVDYVGRVESLDNDMENILDAIGIPDFKRKDILIPQMNISNPSSASDLKNEQVINRIISKYSADFEIFGYPTDPARLDYLGA